MRSPNCPRPYKQSFCECYRSANSSASAATSRLRSTFALSPPPIRTSTRPSPAEAFRQDLFFRLNVVELKMPALARVAPKIFPCLATTSPPSTRDKCNRRVVGISPEAQKLLQAYDWPGNVRELENAIERAVVMGSTEHILSEDLPEAAARSRRTAASTVVGLSRQRNQHEETDYSRCYEEI